MSDSKKKVPKRRFEEFSNANDWELRKLGGLMNITSVKRIHQSDWTDKGVRFLRARDIVSASKGKNPSEYLYISKKLYDEHSKISGKVGVGDLLVTGVGSIGIPMLIKHEEPLYFKDGNIIWFQNKKNIDGGFFYYSFNSHSIQKFIHDSAGIGTVGTYTIDSGGKTPIYLPNKKEQQRIGTFFKQLDNTIALHQRKLEKIKALKTAYLSEMFPAEGETKPKRRFAGFTDDWEQRKLDNSIKVMDGDRGSNYPHDSDFFDNGDTLFLDTGNVTKNGFKFDNVKYITKEKDGQLRAGKLEKNDFVLTSRGTLGNVGFYDKFVYKRHPKLRINSAMLILRNTDEQLSCSYLHTLLKGNLISDFMRKNQVGSAQPHITKSEFLKLDLNVPCDVKEQNKIGDFFKNLDNTITLHQRKLQKLQNIKKAYLNEMFI